MVKAMYRFFKVAQLLFITAFIPVLFLTNCSNTQKEKLKIFTAYQKYKNNKFDESLMNFMQVKKMSPSNEYSELGIATVYLSKNVDKIAEKKFEHLENSENNLIRGNVFYQRGIIQFQNGNYFKAQEFFRKSMECDKTAVDAKINYEICKKILKHQQTNNQSKDETKTANQSEKTDEKILFDLVRQEEKKQWKEKQKNKPENPVNDF